MDEQDGFCTECGAAVSSTDKFCAGCGHQLGDDTPSPSSSPAQTEFDSDPSVEKPEDEKQKDLALSNVRREGEELRRFIAEVTDAPEEVAPDLPQLLEQMTDRYRRVEEALRVAIPFCETDGHAAREMHALTEDVSEQIAAVTAYWAAEIERRDNAERDRVNRLAEDQKSKQESRAGAERDRINRAAKERKSSAEQEQRANAERDRLNRLAQKHRADEQAVQDEANAAFFAEKEQEQQTKAEQKTPSLWDKEKSAVVFVVGFVLLLIAAGNCNSDPDCLYGANGQEICRSDFYDPNEDRIPGRG